MLSPSPEQVRSFRLRAHHLDAPRKAADIEKIVGACGMQNSPPGAWEAALHCRVPGCSAGEMGRLLYDQRLLLQAWSLRGAPYVFPAAQSGVFLSALIPQGDEPWIYTKGIALALDFLQMPFAPLLAALRQAISALDGRTVTSKSQLDQYLAGRMLPLLPADKRDLWERPSMYGSPDKQTVGGAVVSFLLRPCAFYGLVVFGRREGIHPTFTSYKDWTGHPLVSGEDTARRLVRKFLHCFGPATPGMLADWMGCSGKQARRLWAAVEEEVEPVPFLGKKAYILSADRESLFSPADFPAGPLLLSGHDPYLEQRDRAVLVQDPARQRQVFRTAANPGVVLYQGRAAGIWKAAGEGQGLKICMTLWEDVGAKESLTRLAEDYAAFRGKSLTGVSFA